MALIVTIKVVDNVPIVDSASKTTKVNLPIIRKYCWDDVLKVWVEDTP